MGAFKKCRMYTKRQGGRPANADATVVSLAPPEPKMAFIDLLGPVTPDEDEQNRIYAAKRYMVLVLGLDVK